MQSFVHCLNACDALIDALPPARTSRTPLDAEPGAAPPPPAAPAMAPPAPSEPPAEASALPTRPRLSDETRAQLVNLSLTKGRGYCAAYVELALEDCPEIFSVDNLMKVVCAKYARGGHPGRERIGSALWKFVRKHGYRIIREGSGTRPTLYGKPLPPAAVNPDKP